MRFTGTILTLITTSLLCGCELATQAYNHTSMEVIRGSGQATTAEPPVAEFHQIDVQGVIHASITTGGEPKVVLRGDDNIVPLIQVEVVNGRLTIRPQPNTTFEEVTPLEATITTSSVTALAASGASHIELASLKTERLDIEATGASNITLDGLEVGELQVVAQGASQVSLSGTATSARYDALGASKITGSHLRLDTLHADLSGASSGEAQVSSLVTGNLEGASNLKVHGAPAERSVQTSGVSNVAFVPGD